MTNVTEDDQSEAPKIIASAKMTKDQVEMSLVKSLIEQNEDLSTSIDGKSIKIVTQWQTQKGSDPESLVHVYFVESGEASEESIEDNVKT